MNLPMGKAVYIKTIFLASFSQVDTTTHNHQHLHLIELPPS